MLLKIEQVAVLLDVSKETINNWYRFKKENPDNDLAKLLPEFRQEGPRQTRYWDGTDLGKLAEFKANIPLGRNGVMGEITQKWYRKKREEKQNAQKKSSNRKRNNKRVRKDCAKL